MSLQSAKKETSWHGGTDPVWVMGLPLAPLARSQVVWAVDSLINRRIPSYFVTANLNYAMLTARHEDLREINRQAAFVIADGMPLVWESRRQRTPLPERVAGADLVLDLARHAASQGYRLFLLGGPPGIALRTAATLVGLNPGLQIAGVESPDISSLSESASSFLIDRIRRARTDLLLVALGQPKGEQWIYQNHQSLDVPVSVQVGATFEFVAGRRPRAPRWVQQMGLEWVFRFAIEPGRLGKRYVQNGLFYLRHRLTPRHAGRPGLDRFHETARRPGATP